MFKTLINAFKVKDLRKRIFFVLFCLVVVRLGCQIPAPGINQELVSSWLSNMELGFFDALTGGSFTQMSILALNISPYINSSIIMQLMTIAIPALAEMQKDGETGRKKIAEISRYLTIVLALIESGAMAIGFSNNGYTSKSGVLTIILIMVTFTAGSAFLMWLGENITEYGVGNGVSIILTINIVAKLPSDFKNLYQVFIKGADSVPKGVLAGFIIAAVVIVTVVFIILLQDAIRRIPVQYSQKIVGRRLMGGQGSFIPLKVNTSGVIPVIFAISLFQFPIIIASFLGVKGATGSSASFFQKFLYLINDSNWFNFDSMDEFKYTLGAVIYVLLIIFFAYFYTSVTFNPMEVANNMKKSGGFIPGIRPGKPTTEHLTTILNRIVFIGAIMLSIVALLPIVFAGVFNARVSFGGTSLIIIVGVVLETLKQIESMMVERHYKGFLNA
ncbi:MAG: preprotein translocase subunit SecY [Lachnospiraceae bacterium]|nr:preprotein translocase subunit SecY [Lachnospiraceae bacterium]